MAQYTQQLEALLFFKGEPVSAEKLAELLSCSTDDVIHAAAQLKEQLAGRGITLMEKDGAYMLVTAPDHSELIARMQKDELTRDIGKAGIETLSIVLYKGPVSRADIDYIRGVNSSFILRNLQVRGLIERIPDPAHPRAYAYRPTFDLLAHLGVARVSDLPDYGVVLEELDRFQKSTTDGEKADKTI